MKAVILSGGKGTRMREETEYRPKPLVLIGGKPIIWHIMKIYSHYGINDFIVCVGYKGEMIKQYFMEMLWRNNDFTIEVGGQNSIQFHGNEEQNWKVTILDTGLETKTAGRLKQVQPYIEDDNFLFTYGDGLSDVNILDLIQYHNQKDRIATLTGVHPASPFGLIDVEDGIVTAFREKPLLKDLINGGFMILNKKVFEYLPDEDCYFEQEPLKKLAEHRQLAVYEHDGFWTAIDTFKDIERVNQIWGGDVKPWKVWKE